VAAGSFHDTDTAKYTPEDFRFTTKGDDVYAIGLAWPRSREAVIHSLAKTVGTEPVQSVAMIGGDAKLRFEQRADGLHVQLPAQAPAKYAYVLRLSFQHASH
jgi:alpha-L-fucosidase